MSLLEEPIELVGPPELVDAARCAAARLSDAAAPTGRRDP